MMADQPINLATGLPGASKTLNTIAHLDRTYAQKGITVYHSGVRGLDLPNWEQFGGPGPDPAKPWNTDASEWYKLPPGHPVLIDEAQRLFRPRGNGTAVPIYEQQLETLRHNGTLLFLITQDPGLLSTHVRKLVGIHRHYMRKFGSHWATLHEWTGVRENAGKSRKDSISEQVRFPKEYFDKYTSAEVHTVKFGLPLKVKLALLLVVVLLLLSWYVFWGRDWLRSSAGGAPGQTQSASAAGGGAAPSPRSGNAPKPPVTAEALAKSFEPRLEGFPFTAPRYDELSAPVRVPVIVGCWMQGKDAKCITQQGTRLSMPVAFVRSFIENGGTFQDFDQGPAIGDSQEKNRSSGNRGGSAAGDPA